MNKTLDSFYNFIVMAYEYNDKKNTLQQVIEAGQEFIQCVKEARANNILQQADVDHYLAFVAHIIDQLILVS
jgi:hypothetical protein